MTQWSDYKRDFGIYKGFRLVAEVDRVLAYPLTDENVLTRSGQGHASVFEGLDVDEIKCKIDNSVPFLFRIIFYGFSYNMVVTLFNVKKWGDLDKISGPLKVITNNRLVPYCLKAMSTFYMIPDSDVRGACNTSDMEKFLNEIKGCDRLQLFFVENAMFQSNHALISAYDASDNIVVV